MSKPKKINEIRNERSTDFYCWTVQNKSIVEMIRKNGEYFPSFDESRKSSTFISENAPLAILYDDLLKKFNALNNSDYKGLVFAFDGVYDGYFYNKSSGQRAETFDDFKEHLTVGKDAIKGLWKHLGREDNRILLLKYDKVFKPLPIDINHFQELMPLPITEEEKISDIKESLLNSLGIDIGILGKQPEDEEDIYKVLLSKYFSRGMMNKEPCINSGIIQIHLPYIKKENVVAEYDVFEIQYN